jgi:hypothetical protein
MRAAVVGAVLLAAVGAGAPAAAKPGGERVVRCAVTGAGFAAYRGSCRFRAEAGGSFGLRPARAAAFPGGISDVSVHITTPGEAEVRGLTRDGINSRWGEARRSRRDRACWTGADFEVCAW